MLAFERRALLVRVLHGAFPSGEFNVKDIQEKLHGNIDLNTALITNFGGGLFKLKKNLIAIKIGRLLQGKLDGKRFDDYELAWTRKHNDVNYYTVRNHGEPFRRDTNPLRAPEPTPPKPLVIERVDREGRVHREYLRDRNGEPLLDKPTAAPAPAVKPAQPAPLPRGPTRMPKINEGGIWREMTQAEYEASTLNQRILQAAAVHPGHVPLHQVAAGYSDPGGVVSHNRDKEFSTNRRWSQDL